MRALKYVVLPDEDAVEFQALEAALLDELAPEGALQVVLARRVAVAAWRLARADRMEVELFEERRWEDAGVGMALIRDGNGTRSFETLLRYRSAAMAEFWRALKTLKALQAEQALAEPHVDARAVRAPAAPTRSAPRGRRSPQTERTRAPAGGRTCAPTRVRPARPTRTRPHAARARGVLDAERTRASARAPAGAGAAGRARGSSGRSCDVVPRVTHTIGSGRRRRGDRCARTSTACSPSCAPAPARPAPERASRARAGRASGLIHHANARPGRSKPTDLGKLESVPPCRRLGQRDDLAGSLRQPRCPVRTLLTPTRWCRGAWR